MEDRTILPNGVRVVPVGGGRFWRARPRDLSGGGDVGGGGRGGTGPPCRAHAVQGQRDTYAQAIARAVERCGGEIDAYTDHHETTYLARVGPARSQVFAVLADILRRPRLDPADLAKERAVVLEELRTYDDEPATVAYHGDRATLARLATARPGGGRRTRSAA